MVNVKVEVGMLVNVRYSIGGQERISAAEIIKVTPKGYCYVRRIDAGWLGVQFKIGDSWPLKSDNRRPGYQLELSV